MKNNRKKKTFEVIMAEEFYKRHQITDPKREKDP